MPASPAPPQSPAPPPRAAVRRVDLWTGLAGFGLAGLFDSLLLHRLLGWHHLLSAAQPKATAGAQLWADACFDLVSYGLVVAALIGVILDRATLGRINRRCIFGMALVGFGLWNLLDALLAHWLLGLHRVRPGADAPLLWDIGYAAAFGFLPLLVGRTMRATT